MINKIETEIRKGLSNGLMGGNYGDTVEHSLEASRLLNLVDLCEDVPVFKMGERMYFGNRYNAVKDYIKSNPEPADFSVWLQNNYLQIPIPDVI